MSFKENKTQELRDRVINPAAMIKGLVDVVRKQKPELEGNMLVMLNHIETHANRIVEYVEEQGNE